MISFEEELEKSGKLIYTNVGVSMRPLIKQDRDLLVIEKPKGREYGIKEEQIIGVLTSLVRKGKEVDFNSFGYRFYSRFWYAVYPVRVIFMRARSLLGRLYRKCRRAR